MIELPPNCGRLFVEIREVAVVMEPTTEPGRRFVEAAESHADVFFARGDAHDRASSFPAENFEDLKKIGVMAAFVPEALGGLGLDSVHDWAAGLSRIGRGDASTAIALNTHQLTSGS